MTIERRATLSVMLLIVALSALFFGQMARLYRQHMRAGVQHNINEAKRIVDVTLSGVRTRYEAQLNHLLSHHLEIVEAFHERERQKLYDAGLPTFRMMRQESPEFSNMHFHLPNGESFLRMHKPQEYGDDLMHSRPLIAQVHRDRVPSVGFEFGVHGLFYRLAVPVTYGGHYIGALELGIRPEVLLHEIEAVLSADVALCLIEAAGNKSDSNDPSTQTGRSLLIRTGGQDSVFTDLSEECTRRSTLCEVQTARGRFGVYRAGALRDFRGQAIGHLLIAQNIDVQTAAYRRMVFLSFVVTIGLILAAFLILRMSFGHMIRKIAHLNRTLERRVQERTQELVAEKKRVEAAGTELSQIFETAAGGLRVIDRDFRTVRVNKAFKTMIGLEEADIIGRPCYETFPGPACQSDSCPVRRIVDGAERVEREVEKVRKDGTVVPCLLTATPWRAPDGELLGLIEDFTDVTIVKKLLNQQTIDIDLAKRILSLINSTCLRHMDVDDSITLFFQAVSSTCRTAGGDHCFARQLPPDRNHPTGRTVLSLKDQSGHEVNCVLKSIATDLIHNAILYSSGDTTLTSEMMRLNERLTASGLFAADEFVTSMTMEIDHATGTLEYVSCGHPPFLLIREGQVFSFPEDYGAGRHLPLVACPQAGFTAGRLPLKMGDRLILYTDGLTEMPIRHLRTRITTQGLKQIAEDLLEEHESLCVSEIIRGMLDTVSRMSHEQVAPGINTSRDDVTIVGLEVERRAADVENVLTIDGPKKLSDLVVQSVREIQARAAESGFRLDAQRLRCALDEALSNAWKHGSRRSSEKPITLRWRLRNDLHVEVIDEGPGFDPRCFDDPTAAENLLRESGRGLFIIRRHCDEVRWADGGRRIAFSFHRPSRLDRRRRARVRTGSCLNIWQSEPDVAGASAVILPLGPAP